MLLNVKPVSEHSDFFHEINALAQEAFPPEEYLAPSDLIKMAESEHFDFWALLDEGTFIGFMVVQLYQELSYLFFLAIKPEYRSKGYGSRAIETLKALYPGKKQVVDLEMLDASAVNNDQRKSRRAFYLRNGYRETGLFLSYLGVDYEVLCMGDDFDPSVFKAMMGTLKIEGFHPRYFSK